MRFLVDEDLPRSVTGRLRESGYETLDVRDIGLRGATDEVVAAYAKSGGLCLVTGDFDFANIRNYPPASFAGIIVLHIPLAASIDHILNLLNGVLSQSDILNKAPGSLLIVEPGRIRVWKATK